MADFIIKSVLASGFAFLWWWIAHVMGLEPRVLDWGFFFILDYTALRNRKKA